MREIFVNGVAFRYKTERDLGVILHNSRDPSRLTPLASLFAQMARRRAIFKKISDRAAAPKSDGGPLRLSVVTRQ